MPYLQKFETTCSHCAWRGIVERGDSRIGPWRRPDGTVFYHELVCPNCGKQVNNPFPKVFGVKLDLLPPRQQGRKLAGSSTGPSPSFTPLVLTFEELSDVAEPHRSKQAESSANAFGSWGVFAVAGAGLVRHVLSKLAANELLRAVVISISAVVMVGGCLLWLYT